MSGASHAVPHLCAHAHALHQLLAAPRATCTHAVSQLPATLAVISCATRVTSTYVLRAWQHVIASPCSRIGSIRCISQLKILQPQGTQSFFAVPGDPAGGPCAAGGAGRASAASAFGAPGSDAFYWPCPPSILKFVRPPSLFVRACCITICRKGPVPLRSMPPAPPEELEAAAMLICCDEWPCKFSIERCAGESSPYALS